MRTRLSSAALPAVLVLTGLAGLWFGERLAGLPEVPELVAVLVACGAAFATVRRRLARIGAGVLALATFTGSCLAGDWEAGRAYNAAVGECEEIRTALERYRGTTGGFPAELSELNRRLPGNRLLRGSIIDYSRAEHGYIFTISDWLVSHVATESAPCTAHK